MNLALGDTVRVRWERTPDPASGAATTGGGSTVTVTVNRPRTPDDPGADASSDSGRGTPSTAAHHGVVLVFLALGLLAAAVNAYAVHRLDASPLMALVDAFTTVTGVSGALFNLYPRRRRVPASDCRAVPDARPNSESPAG